MKIKRALLSVSDKKDITKLAAFLHENGVEIISTGGTMKAIKDAGIPVTYVSDVSNPEHMAQMKEHGITPIDLVVVNLYPFKQTIEKPGVTEAEAIENIDIGGPAMVRASAKNFRDVVIITNPERYGKLMDMLKKDGDIDLKTRKSLAMEAFKHTSEYDAMITGYLQKQLEK